MVNQNTIKIQADKTSAKLRVDTFLAKVLTNWSRSRIQSLLLEGHIICEQKALQASDKIKGAETFLVNLPDIKPSHLLAQDMPLSILYEDEHIIVINKPAGLVVHPGAGNSDNTLVNALLYRFPGLNVGEVERPGIVHRLDKETSGVMVCARQTQAHLFLCNSFQSREVKKIYRAFCLGSFKSAHFDLKTGHKRHTTDRKRFTTKLSEPLDTSNVTFLKKSGAKIRLAHSRFEVLLSRGGISELKVELLTGRTHQIRAHLADIGHPILKDTIYGGIKGIERLPLSNVKEVAKKLSRHALHAEHLSFKHPVTQEIMEFKAPLPDDLLFLHNALQLEAE
jgi:23S rRNA pseudouridine1911/1915/1917 synthase